MNSALTWSPRLVLCHWLGARASLLFACGLLLRQPEGLAFSPFHPTALACAHLFVLGFLATSIAGAFHLVAPLALRVHVRADWRDWFLFASILIAASGVAAHMALGTYSGVAWSGGLLVAALLLRVPGWCTAVVTASAPLPLRIGVTLAWTALLLAACLGMALAVDRGEPFLPGGHEQALFGHLHLGVAGFALLMVVSLGQRLLPMVLGAAPPDPMVAWAAVLAVGGGGVGLGLSKPFGAGGDQVFAFVLAVGMLVFLADGARMLLWRKPRPADRPRPDAGAVFVALGLLALLGALGQGLLFAQGLASGDAARLRYGELLLLGGLGSLVFGVGSHLLPLAGWFQARTESDAGLPAPPRRTGRPLLQWVAAVTWILGIATLLAAGATHAAALVAAAAGLLAVAIAVDSAHVLLVWRRRGGAPAAVT